VAGLAPARPSSIDYWWNLCELVYVDHHNGSCQAQYIDYWWYQTNSASVTNPLPSAIMLTSILIAIYTPFLSNLAIYQSIMEVAYYVVFFRF
jgi:hypothetical protein